MDFDMLTTSIFDVDCCSNGGGLTDDYDKIKQGYSTVKDESEASPRKQNFGVSKISEKLLSRWFNKTIRIQETRNFQLVIQIDTNHSRPINSVVPIARGNSRNRASDEDPDQIVTASNDNTCQVWNIWDNELLAVFKGHREAPFLAVSLDDGVHILSASCSLRSEVFIWRKDTGELVQNLNPNGENFDRVETATQFTSWNGTAYLAFATSKGDLYIYKKESKQSSKTFLPFFCREQI
jgi:WD40 repeat protein